MLNKKVERYIASRSLLAPKSKVLVALSGGADSVALLCLLLSLGYKVEAAHCNFHLRGEESDRDEAFCKRLCQERGVPLHLAHFDTKTYASLHKVSIEMAARDLRYNYFRQLRVDNGFDAICVAHHKDDSVETVLLNIIRGTGIEGLKGIAPKNGYIVRPLLCVDREEILSYLAFIKQDYVVDSTNLEDDVQRNKVRLNLIPLLRQINPAASRNIAKVAERVYDTLPVIDDAISQSISRCVNENTDATTIDIQRLKGEKAPEVVLWQVLKDKGFSSSQVEQIYSCLSAQSGREWTSATHSLVIDRQRIIVVPLDFFQQKVMRIPEVGTYIYNENRKLRFSLQTIDGDFVISKQADTVCLDADKVKFPLTVRAVRAGDSFVPFGMKGKKLLSDFLTDRKMSVFDKRRQLVVTDSADRIVWVVGLRPDNNFCITPASSKALVIQTISQ